MDFDTERFIIEIQDRPSIWNSKSAGYSDRNLRQKAWEQLVNIYGADLPQDAKKKLGLDLQKKWRNIRDAFVKAHKVKKGRSSSAAKKKVPYVFYDNLLFLKDTVTFNHTDGNTTITEDINTTQNEDDLSLNTPLPMPPAKRSKKNNKDDDLVAAQLVEVLTKNLETKNLEQDDDRYFFLSLVKEFKKIPEYMQMQTKLDILKLINDAQQFRDYPSTSWSGGRLNTNCEYQTAHYSRHNPCTQPLQPSAVRPLSYGSASTASSLPTMEEQSPMSNYSQDSQNSYVELFNFTIKEETD